MRIQTDGDTELQSLLEEAQKLDPIDAKVCLLDVYETGYGIYNHASGDPSRPLALIAQHPRENVTEYSSMYNMIRRYKLYDVGTHFKLSLTEFLALPREYTRLILELLADDTKRQANRKEKVLNDLDKLDY